MIKRIFCIILIIFFWQLNSIAQETGVNIYGGVMVNHSMRLIKNTPISNNNYYFDKTFGLDIYRKRNKRGFEIGVYFVTLVNDFNLRGIPSVPVTKDRIYFKYSYANFKLGFRGNIVKKRHFIMDYNLGFDISYSIFLDRTKENFEQHIIDSVRYEGNRYEIDLKSDDMDFREFAYGLYFSLTNAIPLTDRLDFSFAFIARMGLVMTTESYHYYQLTDNTGNKLQPNNAFVTNKGDIMGLNIGLTYKFQIE